MQFNQNKVFAFVEKFWQYFRSVRRMKRTDGRKEWPAFFIFLISNFYFTFALKDKLYILIVRVYKTTYCRNYLYIYISIYYIYIYKYLYIIYIYIYIIYLLLRNIISLENEEKLVGQFLSSNYSSWETSDISPWKFQSRLEITDVSTLNRAVAFGSLSTWLFRD